MGWVIGLGFLLLIICFVIPAILVAFATFVAELFGVNKHNHDD